MDSLLADRTVLIFLGGLIGGAIGFGLWSVGRRLLPRPSLWLLVGGLAFVGARLLPGLVMTSLSKPPANEQRSPVEHQPARVTTETTPLVPAESPYTTGVQEHALPLDHPLIRALIERDPPFETIVAREIGIAGQPPAVIREFAMSHGADKALTYLPRAGDQPILDLVEAMALSLRQLIGSDPKACYGWLYGGLGFEPFDYGAFEAALGIGLVDYLLTLHEAIVRTAGDVVPPYDIAEARAAISRVNLQLLQSTGLENTSLVQGARAPTGMSDYIKVCQTRFATLQALMAEEKGAAIIRQLYLDGAQ